MDTTPERRAAVPQEAWHRPFVKEHQRWCDDFVLELRMRDVPGATIGDRLAEVEAHCAETGESPTEAFGEPVAYARSLDEQVEPEKVSGSWTVAVLAAGNVLALIVGTSAAFSWARGEDLSYNAVQLAGLAVVIAVLLSLPLLVRPLLARPWRVGLPVIILGTLAAAGSGAAGRLDLPLVLSLPAAAVTVALFAVVLVLSGAECRVLRGQGDGDPITSPLNPPPGVRPRSQQWVILMPVLLIPIAYVALSALPFLLE